MSKEVADAINGAIRVDRLSEIVVNIEDQKKPN